MPSTFLRLADGALVNIAQVVTISSAKDAVVVAYEEGGKVVVGTAFAKAAKDHERIAFDLALVGASVEGGVVWIEGEGTVVSVAHGKANELRHSIRSHPPVIQRQGEGAK